MIGAIPVSKAEEMAAEIDDCAFNLRTECAECGNLNEYAWLKPIEPGCKVQDDHHTTECGHNDAEIVTRCDFYKDGDYWEVEF